MAQLSISVEADKKLNSLKKALARPKKTIVEQSINYLHKLALDPKDVTTGDPSGEIKKLKNTIVSFIRTQEKELVKPTLEFSKYSAEKTNKLIELFKKYASQDVGYKKTIAVNFESLKDELREVVEEREKGEAYAQEMKHRIVSFLYTQKDSIGRTMPKSDYLKIIPKLENDI